MKAKLQALVTQFAELRQSIHVDADQKAGVFAVALEQAHAEAVDPPAPTTLDEIAEGVRALRDAAGV